ncbi:FtsQ-type POTRA domain-containing protein [Agromyces rhizosphaerae]|uniref:FtsQ-type POTRA domain-containing protein n=1 Tax=Agromyces rhizosphaerae TaxID=88374 RepID=UPI002490A05C|nr:FtsQ-type POTRA domain-containing protein [Agromyces rhizosphaerae]
MPSTRVRPVPPAPEPSPAAADAQLTEPIPLVRPGTLADAPARQIDDPVDLPDDDGHASGDDRPTGWRARRELRRATRRRKRYERQEMRRFTKRQRNRRIAWAAGIGSVLLVVGGLTAAAYSPLMAVQEIQVSGAGERVTAEEVVAALDGQRGTPLPLVDDRAVGEALAEFSAIQTWAIERRPPGTLVVRLVERTPIAVVAGGGGFRVVDGAGIVLEEQPARPEGLPLVDAQGGLAGDGFRAASAVLRSLPDDLRASVLSASASTADDVRLELAGGASVVWGSAEESVLKAAVLEALVEAAPPSTVSRYDVSSPRSPVTS